MAKKGAKISANINNSSPWMIFTVIAIAILIAFLIVPTETITEEIWEDEEIILEDECIPSEDESPEFYESEDGNWTDYNCNRLKDMPVGTIFVTANKYSADMGGLIGADSNCQVEADSSNLAGGWIALLSNSEIEFKDRVSDIEHKDVLGNTLSTNKAKMFDKNVDVMINHNNRGRITEDFVFTGSRFTGERYSVLTCADWTSVSVDGAYGHSGYYAVPWIQHRAFSCETQAHLYCIRLN